MHVVRHDVFEQALVVGDDDEAARGVAQGVHPFGDDAQRVNVQPGVGFVQHRQTRFQNCHLHDFVALFLAAGEADIDRAREEAVVHLHAFHATLEQLVELHRIHLALAFVGAFGVHRCFQKVEVADAGDFHRVLEGEENPGAGALVRLHFQQILAVVADAAFGDDVALAPGDDVRQRRFAGAVRPHDGVHFARADAQIDAVQDLFAFFGGNVQVFDF